MAGNDRFVIMGTGRSGTGFVAEALGRCGFTVGHEVVYDYLPSSGAESRWEGLDGDSTLAAIGWPDRLPERRVLVVRHPLAVARSFGALRFWHDTCECHPGQPKAHMLAPYERFIMARVSEIAEAATPLERSIVHQEAWLRAGMSLATQVWVLSDLLSRPEALVALCGHLGRQIAPEAAQEVQGSLEVVNGKSAQKFAYPEVRNDSMMRLDKGPALMSLWLESLRRSSENVR